MRVKLYLIIFIVVGGAFALTTKKKIYVSDEEYNAMPSLFHVDDYDRCMELKEEALYCSITVQLSPLQSDQSRIWKIIQEVSSNQKNYRHDRLRHRICVTKFCPSLAGNVSIFKYDRHRLQNKISECYSDRYTSYDLKGLVTKISCETDQPVYVIEELDIFVAVLVGVILLLAIIGTTYEGSARYKSKEEYEAITNTRTGSIMSCFSVIKNWKRLASKTTNVDDKPLKCMNGIRTYNIIGVVLSHTFVVYSALPTINPKFSEGGTENPINMLVLNGSGIIQVFFVTSAWLLSYNFFKLFEKQKNVNLKYVILAFIHRYIRLTPCLAIVIAFNATWLYHTGSGPFWNQIAGDEYRNCRKNWWVNLLYINNYYNYRNICMLQSWYLSADTQLFALSLLVMTHIWRFQKHTKLILGTCLTVGLVVPGTINYLYDYDIIIRYYPEALLRLMVHSTEVRMMYVPTHVNIGGYAIGLIFGYIYYKYKDQNVFTKTSYLVFWWIFIIGVPLAVVFSAFPFYQDYYEHSRIGAAIYTALGRNLFALAIALGIFGATQKVGWFLRSCVVWPPFQILGRLTYCVFLVHFTVSRIRMGQGRSPNYTTVYLLLVHTLTDVFVSYLSGLLLCLFVEMPTSALQKLLLPKKFKEVKPTT